MTSQGQGLSPTGCAYCANLPNNRWCQDGSWQKDVPLREQFMRFCLAHGINVSTPAALTSLALLAGDLLTAPAKTPSPRRWADGSGRR